MDSFFSDVSASPTLLEVADVETTIRFLTQGFGLRIVSSCADGAGRTFGMLQDVSRSTRVLVIPRCGKAAGGAGVTGGASLTLARAAVHHATSTAVRAGARLLRSHRVQLPRAKNGTPQEGDVDGGSGGACSPSEKNASRYEAEEAGMAWLESPSGAVRVLLLDERFLSSPIRRSERKRRSRYDDGDIEDAAGFSSPCDAAICGEIGGSWSQTAVESQPDGGTPEEDSAATDGGGLASERELEWRSSPSTLLLGIATMARMSCEHASSGSSVAPDGPECEQTSAGQRHSCRESNSNIGSGINTPSCGRNGSIRRHGCSAVGEVISRGDANKELGISIGSGNDGRREGGGVECAEAEAPSGREWSAQARGEVTANGGVDSLQSSTRSSSSAKGLAQTLDVDVQSLPSTDASQSDKGRSEVGAAPSRRAGTKDEERCGDNEKERREGLEGVPGEKCAFHSTGTGGWSLGAAGGGVANEEACLEGGNEDRNHHLAKELRSPERLFPTLEVAMLGNLGGPLRVVPNSLAPIPIDNEYFVGKALLMIRREPMDEAYAHMFKGKNRMFEVQVQGRFKKPPDSELYISLEITDRMKLSLITKGLCRLLLSFGQKMNNRLHYSFGDAEDRELPHMAFPLLMSVDSLICTPDGEEPPVLGMPFEEDPKRRASRRRGEAVPDGFDQVKPGCTYSFSFHSMYMDMVKWSTCKIPIMRDVDLSMFWGDSALRITAYFIKKPNAAAKEANGRAAVASSSKAKTPPLYHLQSELQYVFCLKVRRLLQDEQDEAASRGELDALNQRKENRSPSRLMQADREASRNDMGTRHQAENMGKQAAPTRVGVDDDFDDDDDDDGFGGDLPQADGVPIRSQGTVGATAAAEIFENSESASDVSEDESDIRREARDEGSESIGDRSRLCSRSAEVLIDMDYEGPSELVRNLRAGGGSGGRNLLSLPGLSRRASVSNGQVLSSGKGLAFPREQGRGGKWENGGQDEDMMVRCPAYLDLYAGSPKLNGTWTVYCVVKRGPDGRFSLRSSKNLSILPSNLELTQDGVGAGGMDSGKSPSVAPKSTELSPRLSHREVKRRKFDTLLQLLTAPSRANLNGSHQIVMRAVLGMESSADRAFRSFSPNITGCPSMATEGAKASSAVDDAGGRFEDDPEGRAYPEPGSCDEETLGQKQENGTRMFAPRVSADEVFSPARRNAGSFMVAEVPSLDSSSRDSSDRFGQGEGFRRIPGNGGNIRRPSRGWGSKSSLPVKEGMVLRALSEHHLSQQMAVLLPSSLTFSRPRKQCLRLLTGDILKVEVGGCEGENGQDALFQLIPGMFPVEVHTLGRVHYMLVEGLSEARSWATAIERHSGDEGRGSPRDEVIITDSFGQFMTKRSCWRAKNVWILNARRIELSSSTSPEEYWGDGCWLDRGGLGGEICDFVADLLRQAVELDEDSKLEQVVRFLDDVCRLRWMPLEGLSHAEQLAVFLNLYHVMLLHVYLIRGAPSSSLRAASCFTTLWYEVGGEVLSLADLEHRILRARSNPPKQFLSKLIIPSADYPFALRQPEARVSFALNCGTVSGVPGTLLYRPESVEQQLEDASTYYVQSTTEVLRSKRTVLLPRIVYWYIDDFCENESNSPLACLMRLKRYLVGDKRRDVEALIADGGSINVKFDSWSWKCRRVSFVDDSELERLRSVRDVMP